jgi:hypothetical protein
VKIPRLPRLLAIAIVTLVPGLVRADNIGATRVPRQVRALQNAPASGSSLGGVETRSGSGEIGASGRVVGSKTLGDGKKDPGARRIENTAESLSAPGGVMGMDAQPGEYRETITTTQTGPVPALHVVQKGDTLWSLCSKYWRPTP